MGTAAIRLALGLVLTACLMPPLLAQKSVGKRARKHEDIRGLGLATSTADATRQNYEEGRSDGMKLEVNYFKEGKFVPVDPEQVFNESDRIKIKFESNFDGYVYVINITPGGERRLLFPYPHRSNKVRAGQRYDLPRTGEFKFDKEQGVEVLQVVISRSQVAFLEAALYVALKKSDDALDGSTVKLVEYLTGKSSRPKKGGVFLYRHAKGLGPKENRPVQTRGLSLGIGKGDTVVTVSASKKATTAHLQRGEVSIFEIRLKHY